MLKFIAISILFMIVECMIADKLEALLSERGNEKQQDQGQRYETDMETLKILSDYGLINSESYKCNSDNLNKA